MHHVYLERSPADFDRRYVGFTANLNARVKSRNEGASIHATKYRPWKLIPYRAFEDARNAREFEDVSAVFASHRTGASAFI